MAARGDPLAATRPPVQPAPGAEPSGSTLPELERRLLIQRSAVVDSVERLRGRVRRDLRNLSPLRQAQRRPEAALALSAVVGLVTGRILGGIAARLMG